jgi:hypothetical protein
MKRLLSGTALTVLSTSVLLAQSETPTPIQLSDAQAAGLVATVCGMGAIPIIISIGLWLWAAIFVMKDAKRRNSPNATLVTVLTWLPPTWFIGWLIHMITRPKTIPGGPAA